MCVLLRLASGVPCCCSCHEMKGAQHGSAQQAASNDPAACVSACPLLSLTTLTNNVNNSNNNNTKSCFLTLFTSARLSSTHLQSRLLRSCLHFPKVQICQPLSNKRLFATNTIPRIKQPGQFVATTFSSSKKAPNHHACHFVNPSQSTVPRVDEINHGRVTV